MREWFPPGCRARHCTLTMDYDIPSMSRRIQHNRGGEAILLISDRELTRVERLWPLATREALEMHMAQRLLRWTERVHAYEEGRPISDHWEEPAAAPSPDDEVR